MRRLGVFVLLFTSLAAGAADWSRMRGMPGDDRHYLDRSKLVVSGNEITYWRKIVFQTPQTVQGRAAASGLLRERINCSVHTLKVVSYLYYAADGGVIEYVASQEGDASPIIPDTLGDLLEKRLCPQVWEKQAEARRKQAEADALKQKEAPAATSPSPPATAVPPAEQSSPDSEPDVPADAAAPVPASK
jgi:hypothetical protein